MSGASRSEDMWLEGFFTLPITIITAAMILAYIFEGHPRLDAEAYSYEEREQQQLSRYERWKRGLPPFNSKGKN